MFALLSGIADDSWTPIHEFCERERIPCLFPNTDLPVVGDGGLYTFYYSGGLVLEAQALARHLHEGRAEREEGHRIVQVFDDGAHGTAPARALREALGTLEEDLEDHRVRGAADLTPEFWRRVLAGAGEVSLVLWLDGSDLDGRTETLGDASAVRHLYLSSRMLAMADHLAPGLRDRTRVLHPFSLARELEPTVFQDRSWLHSRGIRITDERLQLDAYFAATIADHALQHIIDTFSREYLMEAIEHDTEESLTFGSYAHLGLGPGQRFASKGCYIVRPGPERAIEAVSGWIVP